jgi:hypothetical protein
MLIVVYYDSMIYLLLNIVAVLSAVGGIKQAANQITESK